MNAGKRFQNVCRWLTVMGAVFGLVWAGWRAEAQPAATQPSPWGPDVVMMRELVDLYEPVPFSHKAHAKMADMWNGCVTCHHRNPEPTTQPACAANGAESKTQAASATIPACKSCHAVSGKEADIRMPNLKGAYHRQCLNCHQEWMHGNNCAACHRPRDPQKPMVIEPTADDIVGRMHPPIPEPQIKQYKTRFTPADGGNVLFRHEEHTARYGLTCAHCHRGDSCARCHDSGTSVAAAKSLRTARTWAESHGACASCHQQDRCRHCHYKDDQAPPPPFEHSLTGQTMDADHADLKCSQCHAQLRPQGPPTCGDSSCHDASKAIAFPAHRPGPLATTRPATTRPAPTTGPAPARPAAAGEANSRPSPEAARERSRGAS